jgi:methenyltetrahydromethanopterin cyclohydrolase
MSIDVNIGSHSLNMANGNFASLWAILDLPVESEGSVNAGDLTARIMLAQVMGVQERPTVRDGNFIHCGIDTDYIERRFDSMLTLLAQIDPGEVVHWW